MELVVQEVSHRYKDKPVLTNITHSFAEKKVTAVLGKSGSGKTTLLQIINGMLKPDSGTVTAFGEPLNYNELPELRLKMGYVIQQAGLFPHMNLHSNISLLGKIKKLSDGYIHTRVSHLMNLVQLPVSYSSKYPHELSGGEQQRTGLCRAMFLNPPVLLMDEPFGSLDYETKQGIYSHLMSIQENEPRTIIMITHDWDEALRLADEFIWLKDGKIRASGGRNDLIKAKKEYFEVV